MRVPKRKRAWLEYRGSDARCYGLIHLKNARQWVVLGLATPIPYVALYKWSVLAEWLWWDIGSLMTSL